MPPETPFFSDAAASPASDAKTMGASPHSPILRWHDWLLLLCSAALIVAGPVMSLQELSKAQDQKAALALTGTLPPVDGSFRLAWRVPLTVLVLVTGLVGTITLVRVMLDVGVRALARRLLVLLMLGLVTLYLTYYLDGLLFAGAEYGVRAVSIVWMYPAAGLLIGGSVHRLAELVDHFGQAAPSADPIVI